MRTLHLAHHKSPINEYDFVAVRLGFVSVPVAMYEGRPCFVQSESRVRHTNKAHGFYNRLLVEFLDNGESVSMGAGQFNKKAKTAPLSLVTTEKES
jgi:hypothetical protein